MQLIDIGDRRVVQIRPDDSIDQAIALMEEHGFRHLPVVDRGCILGMVSDRDLLAAVGMLPGRERTATTKGPARLGATRISQIISRPADTVEANAPLEVAAELMLAKHIRAVPLVYLGRLAGIVTETDFLKCYLDDRPVGRRQGWRLQKVGDHMSQPVVTLRRCDTFLHAVRVMKSKAIRHLPILEDEKLVGIVSDRDLRRALGSLTIDAEDPAIGGPSRKPDVLLGDIMTGDVATTNPPATLAEVADIMVTGKFGSLPVMSNARLTGIITEADLLRIFAEACKA